MRLASDFVVSALVRRVQNAGAYATIARRGDKDAGAIFVLVDGLSGTVALYGPAPSYLLDGPMPDEAALTGNRVFTAIALEPASTRAVAEAFVERQASFDPDLWCVDIEDRAMRSFLPVLAVD